MTDITPTRRRAPATVAEVNAMRSPGRHSVGDGLLLVVNPSGSRSWLARIRDPQGKRRDIGLGRYPEVTLKEARDRAAEMRRLSRAQIDPLEVKRKAKDALPTFKEAAEVLFQYEGPAFRNLKHRHDWIRSLREYAYPALGRMAVDKITGPMIVQAMKPIWLTKPETSRRVLQRIAKVIEFAVGSGWREHEAPIKSIRAALGSQPKRIDEDGRYHSTPKHHAAVPYEDAPALFQKLRGSEPTLARQALLLIALTAARSGEARGARWEEFDLDRGLWTIPGTRMKAGVQHVVPLSSPAVEMLATMKEAATGELLFPGIKNSRRASTDPQPLSDAAVSKVMKAAAPGYTVHGWRSTFRDWTSEETATPSEVAEKALAHQISNAVERAYRRGNLLEKRRQLMVAWANFLEGKAADVRHIGRVAA